MQQKTETFYRNIFSDLTLDREESAELVEFFENSNPPPDCLVWLRSTAFRLACESLSDDKDSNVALLRCVNAMVHALEQTCMEPKELDSGSSFDADKAEEFYRELFGDLSVDREENEDLVAFFRDENTPGEEDLVTARATAFRVGCDYLSEDRESNVKLLKCINVIVHALETSCLKPKPYELKMEVPEGISVDAIGMDASIEKAVQHLWDLDANRITPNKDYVLNVQEGKKPYEKHDGAEDPLFTSVDTSVFRRPTYKTFYNLLDNYVAQVGTEEMVTDAERQEVWDFLTAIMQTAPMQFCHKYCRANNPDDVPGDLKEFMKLLHKIWFDMYRRGGTTDSSGFEHVFVGEVKDGKVSGFHNWIMFYLEEKKGDIDYRGYIKPRGRNEAETNSDDHILTLQFAWNGVEKMVGTSFIGVSPEFEMALYTTCFLCGQEDNKVTLNTGTDEFDLNIKVYTMAHDKIGTSYPEALSHND
jgi:poly(U)-specific endoribonuclease